MAEVEKSKVQKNNKSSRKENELKVWRVLAWSMIVFVAGAYAMHWYDGKISADKQAAVHAAVSAVTAPAEAKAAPGK